MKRDARPDFEAFAGDLFGEMVLAESAAPAPRARRPLSRFVPGLAIAAIAGAAAAWLAQNYGVPVILAGLLTGLALNFVAGDTRTHDGLDAVSRHGLRAGIVLLGFQVTAMQVLAMGAVPFLGLALVMAAALFAALAAARVTGQSPAIGLLGGGATAICGASAALALYGVIGRERVDQAQFTLTLVILAAASAIALVTYPMLATALDFSNAQAGFLTGAAIHDVAQSIGAGLAVSDAAGAQATVVKLTRVALLAPLVTLAALWIARAQPLPAGVGKARVPLLPGFILAFLALVAANSLVTLPAALAGHALTASKTLLLLAVTATAMRTRTDLLLGLGWRAVMPVLAATIASLVVALGFAIGVIP
ncbi:putative sulfate exporter family transporter [Porphyrobacter sp. YT40]|uniref:YeiH family protein n=1 Tax=Porphyrobacter sp. YT40 TaxID=2547601 RepID=UPI00114425F6|nr:putative sulfate exporter family transporter [Porphyrobacter sp. YT40]QDH35727.1 putative sulfate exporter family transporter [Porphyrobacter sp. YT40]